MEALQGDCAPCCDDYSFHSSTDEKVFGVTIEHNPVSLASVLTSTALLLHHFIISGGVCALYNNHTLGGSKFYGIPEHNDTIQIYYAWPKPGHFRLAQIIFILPCKIYEMTLYFTADKLYLAHIWP